MPFVDPTAQTPAPPSTPPPPPVPVATLVVTDCDGTNIEPGDLVTLTFRATAAHPITHPDTGEINGADINLAVKLPTGNFRHFGTVNSKWVKKI